MGIQRAGVVVQKLFAPDGVVQIIAVQNIATAAQQQQQQLVFLGGQRHDSAVLRYGAGGGVHRDIPCGKHRHTPPCPAQNALDPRHQLGGGKGLDDVIVRAAVQPLHPVGYGRLGGDENAGRAGGAYVAQQVIAVHTGHHNIQQNKVVLVLLQQIGGSRPVVYRLAGVPGGGQHAAYQGGDGRFVIDN